jgi:hypothetical protein
MFHSRPDAAGYPGPGVAVTMQLVTNRLAPRASNARATRNPIEDLLGIMPGENTATLS